MLKAITGQLRDVGETSVSLEIGPMLFELLIPASDAALLQSQLGEVMTFHTLMYIEGDPNRGNLEPRVIGFRRREDRRFFELFTTVNGIGPRKALKALTIPMEQVASAIESGNTRALVELPQIGKRLAEQIIATLSGKLGDFVIAAPVTRAGVPSRRSDAENDAIEAMIALGERRNDAEALLDRVKRTHTQADGADVLIREMLALRTGRG